MEVRKRLSKLDDFIKKKIPYGSDIITPKKKWLQTVPAKDCDVVMVFPPDAETGDLMGVQTVMSYLQGLQLTVKKNSATGSFVYYFQASFESLIKGGEAMRILKRTKSQYGGDLKELTQKDIKMFQDSEDQDNFFTTQERQSIVFYLLNSFRSPNKDAGLCMSILEGEAVVPILLSRGIISNIFPIHEYKKLKALKTTWVPGIWKKQPIEDIKQYFGCQIAIYFAWLGHYTTALIIPAILGIIFWWLEDKGLVAFAFLNVIWTSVWLESWKRRSAEIAFSWGTLDAHQNIFSEPRPQFKGDHEMSTVTGRWERDYPNWKRNVFRYLVSLPLIAVTLYLVFRVMLIMLQIQDVCQDYFATKVFLSYFSFAPKTLMAIPIALFNRGCTKLSIWLNNKENHRSEEDHQNNLIAKLLLFRFVNSFLSLFYIAFYLQDLTKLREQLAALLLTKQLIGNFKESILSYLKKRHQLAKLSYSLFGPLVSSSDNSNNYSNLKKQKEKVSDDEEEESDKVGKEGSESDTLLGSSTSNVTGNEDTNECGGGASALKGNRMVPQVDVESQMAPYDGTYKDYLEIFIQFGYVTLFSSAFPLAAAFALVTNILEIRSDAFKFCYVYQRPFGHPAQNIGVWQDAMELMGVLSILVNCALIGLSGQIQQIYPDITTVQIVILIFLLEHVLIALKFGISYAVPDVPQWVEKEIAKKEFQRREFLKGK